MMKHTRSCDLNQSSVFNCSIQKTSLVIILILMLTFVSCDEVYEIKRNTPTEAVENEDKSSDEAVTYDEYPVGAFF